MTRILVVDECPEQTRLIGGLLEAAGFDAELVDDGARALERIDEDPPDLVITDLMLSGVNGLQLIEAVRERRPRTPVILMTAIGQDEIAVRALRRGAASYVPKRRLRDELVGTVRGLLAVARAEEEPGVADRVVESDTRLVFENDQTLIPPFVRYLQRSVRGRWSDCDEGDLVQIGVAVQEAMLNAMHHGNLQVSSELREAGGDSYLRLIERRRQMPGFRERRVEARVWLDRESLRVDVRDEGPGFDPEQVGNPTDPANLERVSGRGLYLIWTFMDQVTHNPAGNRITMLKHRQAASPRAAARAER